jgi:hypothetical protein
MDWSNLTLSVPLVRAFFLTNYMRADVLYTDSTQVRVSIIMMIDSLSLCERY